MAGLNAMYSKQGAPQQSNEQSANGDAMMQSMKAMQSGMGSMGGMSGLPQMQNMNMMAQMPQMFSRMGAPQDISQGRMDIPERSNRMGYMMLEGGHPSYSSEADKAKYMGGIKQSMERTASGGASGDMAAQMAERMKRYQAAGGGQGMPMQQQMQNMQAQMGGMGSQGFGNMQGQLARTQEAMTGNPFGNAIPYQMGQFMNQMGQGAQMQNPYMGQSPQGAPMQNRMGNMFNQMGQMPSTSWNLNGPMGQAMFGTQNQYSYWPQGQMNQMQNRMQQSGPFGPMNPMQAMGYYGGY